MEYSREKYEGKALKKSYDFGFLYTKEVIFLQALAWMIRKDNPVIVNIGAGVGTSTLAFREARKDAKIYTIDISEESPNGGLQNERNAFKEAGYEIHTQILGNSQKIHKEFDKQIDLLFIDGDHSYKGCYKDCLNWFPKINKLGIIAIHDYDSIMWGDVTKAVDDFFETKPSYEIGRIDTIKAFRKI